MRRKKTLVFFIAVNFAVSAAQHFPFSLTRSPDARAMVMGESFVAAPFSPFSIDSNPATLLKVEGVIAFYNYRDLRWIDFLETFKIEGAGVATSTSFGHLGLFYKRYTLGELSYTVSSPDPKAIYNKVEQTFVISLAMRLTDRVGGGINVKLFNQVNRVLSGTYDVPNSKNSYLLDIGFLYSTRGLIRSERASDEFRTGLSLQNFGTDFEFAPPNFTGDVQYFTEKLPRSARIGFCYSLESHAGESWSELGSLLTAEYRRYLNPRDFEKHQTDFWGFGVEIGVFRIIALRMGGVIQPYTDIFGEKEKLTLRYGFGINLPAEMFDVSYPVSVSFDYGLMPINVNLFGTTVKNLPAMNFQISYDFTKTD